MGQKKLLSGFINESLQIIRESDEQGNSKPLKIRGIFAKMDEENGNGRIYPRSLWEKVLADPKLKTKLEKRRMLGELRHPEYRDIDPERSAFVVTKLWAEGSYVMGEAEVLPAPTPGAILEALLSVQIVPGVSSRGEGSVVEKAGQTIVSGDDYELITFDMTMDPSVGEAFPAVVESKMRTQFTKLMESNVKLNESCYTLMERLLNVQDKKSKPKVTLVNESTQGKKMSDNSQQMKSVVSRLDASLRSLSESKVAIAEHERTIKALKSKVAEQRSQLTTLATKSNELVEAYKNEQKVSAKSINVIAEMRNRFQALSESSKNQDQTANALHEQTVNHLHKRYAELVEGIVKNYVKSLRVIETLVVEHKKIQESKKMVEGHYNRALQTLDQVNSRISESKVESYLRRELRNVGGFEKFSTLIGDVKDINEAKEKVAQITALVEGREIAPTRRPERSNEPINVGKLRERKEIRTEQTSRTSGDPVESSVANIIASMG